MKSTSLKISITTLLLLLVVTFGWPFTTQAACNIKGTLFGNFEAPLPGLEGRTIDDVACNDSPFLYYTNFIIKLITAVVVILGLIIIVIAGYIYMTAGGDGSKVEKAKSMIKGALLGIIIALSAFMILNTISPQFAGQLKEPQFLSP